MRHDAKMKEEYSTGDGRGGPEGFNNVVSSEIRAKSKDLTSRSGMKVPACELFIDLWKNWYLGALMVTSAGNIGVVAVAYCRGVN